MTFNFPSPKMQACVYTGTPSRSPAPRNNMSSGFDNTRKKTVVSLRAERLRAQIEVTLGFQISTRKWYAYASLQSNAFQRFFPLISHHWYWPHSLLQFPHFCSFQGCPAFLSPPWDSLLMKAKQPPDPEVSLWFELFSLKRAQRREKEKVIVSIWAPETMSLFSSPPGDMHHGSSSLQQIKRECH